MTARLGLVAAAMTTVATVAACGKQPGEIETVTPAKADAAATPAPAADADLLPPGFPKPTAEFLGVYEMGDAGEAVAVTIAGSGPRQRIEFPPGAEAAGPDKPWSQIMVSENNGATIVMWPEGEAAPKVAASLSRRDVSALAVSFGVDAEAGARGKKVGEDRIAGERCAVWEMALDEGADAAPGTVCVTKDGIMLRTVAGGETVMLAKSIKRGPQDASRFAPPADYEVVDMGECLRIGAEAMALARDGKAPDLAKMERCRVLGEKMGAMYGE